MGILKNKEMKYEINQPSRKPMSRVTLLFFVIRNLESSPGRTKKDCFSRMHLCIATVEIFEIFQVSPDITREYLTLL
jgi:hypothetical protein